MKNLLEVQMKTRKASALNNPSEPRQPRTQRPTVDADELQCKYCGNWLLGPGEDASDLPDDDVCSYCAEEWRRFRCGEGRWSDK